jgi:hypothetical protein
MQLAKSNPGTHACRRFGGNVNLALFFQEAIADHLGLHYSSVSKVINQEIANDSRFKT